MCYKITLLFEKKICYSDFIYLGGSQSIGAAHPSINYVWEKLTDTYRVSHIHNCKGSIHVHSTISLEHLPIQNPALKL